MAKLMAAEVLPYILRTIDGVEGLQAGESHWTNGEVLELLGIVADGLRSPEWAQVTVSELIEERDNLRLALAGRDVEEELATMLWQAAYALVEEQRDQARSVAVRLEQELAFLTGNELELGR